MYKTRTLAILVRRRKKFGNLSLGNAISYRGTFDVEFSSAKDFIFTMNSLANNIILKLWAAQLPTGSLAEDPPPMISKASCPNLRHTDSSMRGFLHESDMLAEQRIALKALCPSTYQLRAHSLKLLMKC